ncbi:MATE family efflux transporter [Brucepastera parasyntrophica]|uniref:MATE family efflux transporter n=1 Tax=Brucepastera parasyntrophica TaxID=2880008 RepID=UPI00210B57BC|nr:MATE family efflux transporter [Brucepastera parasyntrophica]ULQ58541.1 MATE family efflux transporter [Brucepastera parasyntrophica]
MGEAAAETGAPEIHPLGRRFSLSALLRFAFPTIFMMMFSGLYTIVDTVFVARFVGTNALSAINIVTPVINIIVGLGTMLSAGGSAVVARNMGSRRNREAGENFSLIVLAGVITGAVITIMGLMFLEPVIRALGASEVLLPYAKDYLAILFLFAPANMLQVLFANFFVTAGKPGLGMGLGLAAGLTNALLDFIFIVPLGMGIRGAALATGLGYLVPAAGGILFFFHNRTGGLRFTRPRLRFRVLGESCFNGSSEMVSQLSAAVTTFLFNRAMMSLLGEDGVAAITIIIYSQFLLTTFYIGFSMGVAPIFGYNYGSGSTAQIKRLLKICLGFIAAVSVIIFALSELCGPFLAGMFAGNSMRVFTIARRGFVIFPFSFLFCGINIFTSAFFTALSNGKVSAAVSFLRTFVFLTAGILTLPIFLGVDGIWLAVPLAEAGTLVVSVFFLRKYGKPRGLMCDPDRDNRIIPSG